jgi:hypothetical protein
MPFRIYNDHCEPGWQHLAGLHFRLLAGRRSDPGLLLKRTVARRVPLSNQRCGIWNQMGDQTVNGSGRRPSGVIFRTPVARYRRGVNTAITPTPHLEQRTSRVPRFAGCACRSIGPLETSLALLRFPLLDMNAASCAPLWDQH